MDYDAVNKQFGFYKVFELINNSWIINNPLDPVPKICHPNEKYEQEIDEYWIQTHVDIGERSKYFMMGSIRFTLTCPNNVGIGRGYELIAFLARIVDDKQIDNVWTERLTNPISTQVDDNYLIIANLIYHMKFCGN